MRIRQRPQQHRVDDAKNRSVCADTKRKHENGDECECWLLKQLPERESKIFKHSQDAVYSVQRDSATDALGIFIIAHARPELDRCVSHARRAKNTQLKKRA